jgi:hypothetical protein
MPIDLEKEIVEIRERLAGIDEKLDKINILADDHYELEGRVRKIEIKLATMIGYALGAAAVISAIISVVTKLI